MTTPARERTTGAPVEEPSIGQLASDASEHLSTIIRGEIALAKTEIGAAVKNAGTGAVMFLAAAAILVFSLTFGLIALAEGLVYTNHLLLPRFLFVLHSGRHVAQPSVVPPLLLGVEAVLS